MIKLNLFIQKNKYTVAVILLTILATLLRFYHIEFNNLWGDEIATLAFVSGSVSDIWAVLFTDSRPSPPLFYILEHFMLYFGDSELILRFLPAIFGVLSIPLIYLVGKELINENIGLIVATLLTVSQYHIYMSQDARTYTLTMLLFLIATYFYIKSLKSGKKAYRILFPVFAALAFWSHFHVIFGIIALYIHYFIINIDWKSHRIKNLKCVISSGILFTFLISPLLIVLLLVTSGAKMSYGWGLFVVPHSFFSLLRLNLTSITLVDLFVVCLLSILGIFGVFALWKRKRNSALLLILTILIPFVLVLFATIMMDFHTAGTHILYVLPFLLLAISSFVLLFEKMIKVESVTKVLVVVILISSVLYLPGYYTTMTHVDYGTCSEDLSLLTNDGDVVISSNSVFNYYYDSTSDNTVLINSGNLSINDIECIAASQAGKSVYYVTSLAIITKNLTEIAPSGSSYLDSLLIKMKFGASSSNNSMINKSWLSDNAELCISHLYKGIYHPDVYVYKLNIHDK